jgi:hypothetical protein
MLRQASVCCRTCVAGSVCFYVGMSFKREREREEVGEGGREREGRGGMDGWMDGGREGGREGGKEEGETEREREVSHTYVTRSN